MRQAPLSAEEVQPFRASLQSLVTWLSQTKTNNPNQQALATNLEQRINNLTSNQMTALANCFDAPAFNTAVTLLVSTPPSRRNPRDRSSYLPPSKTSNDQGTPANVSARKVN